MTWQRERALQGANSRARCPPASPSRSSAGTRFDSVAGTAIRPKPGRHPRRRKRQRPHNLLHPLRVRSKPCRAVARAAGVPDFRPHRLRDTFVVSLLTAGASMSDVCAVLGHLDVQAMERRYARWYRRQDRLSRIIREARQLDPILLEVLGNAITSAALTQV